MYQTPVGMNRRHFLNHLAGAAALSAPAAHMFANALRANAADLQKRGKACILMFMNGGPSTIDIWDLKPGAPTGGPFKKIQTSAPGVEISEHLPKVAKQFQNLAIIRSMSTREADHNRGRYYMHTGYVPNPSIEHPSYGAVIAHELAAQSPNLEIPAFVSIGSPSFGPGFLGAGYSPFVVDSNGQVRNLDMDMDRQRLAQRMQLLGLLERNFAGQNRGELPVEHGKVLDRTVKLMTSKQMEAFKIDSEPDPIKELYGLNAPRTGGGMGMAQAAGFGRSCLMARRLVETGVPFVEIDLGGWDDHDGAFPKLEQRLAVLDTGMNALLTDLGQRGLLQDTTLVWMGDFGRTPRINGRAGRDHWARSWSVVVGGGGIKGGQVVGATNEDGTQVTTTPYSAQDVMATVLKAMGISLEITYTSKNNRPMKIANSGTVIKELV